MSPSIRGILLTPAMCASFLAALACWAGMGDFSLFNNTLSPKTARDAQLLVVVGFGKARGLYQSQTLSAAMSG